MGARGLQKLADGSRAPRLAADLPHHSLPWGVSTYYSVSRT